MMVIQQQLDLFQLVFILKNPCSEIFIGESNETIIIDNIEKLIEFFDSPYGVTCHDKLNKKKKSKQIFNELDPYGEENWEE